MARTCVRSVLASTVEIFDDPVKPTAKVVFGPSLDVVKEQLLRSVLRTVDPNRVLTGNDDLDVVKLFDVAQVVLAVKTTSLAIFFSLLGENRLESFLKNYNLAMHKTPISR